VVIDYIPIDAKKMANSPSSTMTKKIDFTTDVVVCRPERFRASLDFQAFAAGDRADCERHERRLDDADQEMIHGDGFAQPVDKNLRAHSAIEPGHKSAAHQCRHGSQEGQDRECADERKNSRENQDFSGIESHGA
jgi:hypothetical protein